MGDGNGALDKSDFECLAVRNTVIEGKGNWDEAVFKKNQEVMANLWNEIAELADFNKDGEVSADEFMKAIEANCERKSFAEFPQLSKPLSPVFSKPLTLTVTAVSVLPNS